MKSSDRPYVIVVGIDYSETSHVALRHAFQIASERHQTEVHVLHVQTSIQPCPYADPELPTAEEVRDRTLERLQGFVRKELASFQEAQRRPEGGSLEPVSHVRGDAPAEEIAQLASDLRADLIVVSTHGKAGEARLGSVEHAVVTLAPCPVLIVREKGHRRPRITSTASHSERCVEARVRSAGKERCCEQHETRHAHHQGEVVGPEDNFPADS